MPKKNLVRVFSLVHTNVCSSFPQHMTGLIKSVTLISLMKRDILKTSLIKKIYLNEINFTIEFWYTGPIISSPVQNQMRQFGKHTEAELSKAKSA